MSVDFYSVEPTLENYWRGVILFGKNSASYKFALAKSLLEMSERKSDFISLEELAEPFSRHTSEHLKSGRKQITRQSSPFIDACKKFNSDEFSQDELIQVTAKEGFKVVLDKFHNLNSSEIPQRFFIDERKGSRKGIRLNDNLFKLLELRSSENLTPEVEARWQLVETAWELDISRDLIAVSHDPETEKFFVSKENRRVDVTSSRDALNGYQKSKCFYCFDYISIVSGSQFLADVDHFFPHLLKPVVKNCNLDGVWNLALSCTECNGPSGKWTKIPSLNLVKRLSRRNEYLISSNHPLKETIIGQTGKTTRDRARFIQRVIDDSCSLGRPSWEPKPKEPETF